MPLSPAELKEIEDRSAPFTGIKAPTGEELPGGMTAYPTAGEKLTETAIGAAQGTTKAGTMLGGGLTGARIGMAVAPFLGPAAPVAPVIGLGTGLVAGYFGGEAAEDLFPAVKRQDLAPYREGGKTFGESIAFAPVAFGIPVMQANRVARFVSGIGEAARAYPKTFLTSETLGALGSGIGGGVAVSEAPESPGTRFAAELAGGFFAPGRFVANMSGTAFGLIKNLKNEISATGRQRSAANRIVEELEKAGEDLPTLIKLLEAPTPPGAIPTAAQKTGSPVLSALETKLAQGNAKFGADNVRAGQETMQAYQALIMQLERSGNPAAFRKAAELRQTYFQGLLDGRLALADAESAAAISRISKDTPAARVQIGEIVKDNTTKALKDARDYERVLWDRAVKDLTKRENVEVIERVPLDYNVKTDTWTYESIPTRAIKAKEVSPVNTVNDFLSLMVNTPEIVAKRTLPPIVKDIMESFGVTENVVRQYKAARNTQEFMDTGTIPFSVFKDMNINRVEAADLLNYRTQLLDLAREANGKGELANARFYGTIAEGLLQDLNRLESPALDAARQFSKDLNDTFTRTFADEITAKNVKGGAKIPAEILVQRAFGGNSDLTSMRMKDIEDAAGFMQQKYALLPDKRTAEAIELRPYAVTSKAMLGGIQGAQTQVLRLAAARAITPEGRLNTSQLQRFISENKEALDRMGITADLQDAVQAENILKAVTSANSKLTKVAQNQSAFGQVLKYESPVDAVTDALNSKFPVKNISNMAKMARNAGIPAVEGMRSTMLDYAYTKAVNKEGYLDPQAFKSALFDPIQTGQPSLINIMRSQGIMSQAEARNLRRVTDSMDRVQLAMKNRVLMDELVNDASALDDLVMRLIGVHGASMLGTKGPGALVIAGAGSQAARNIFGKMPNMLVRGVMEQASQDPVLMAQLLKRGTTQADKLQMARQLHGYLGAAGLNYTSYEEPPAPPPQTGNAARQLRQLPAAPPTRGVPGVGTAPSAGQAPASAPSAPGPQSSSRQMLQSLFPYDTLLQAAAPEEGMPAA